MVRPRLLDLFCGAGGASVGYHRAGFDVVGVDINAQPRYPFRFVRADIAAWASIDYGFINDLDITRDFDAIHASPPCQAHTPMSNRWRGKGGFADTHSNLIPVTRELCQASGLPYVIENVNGAKHELRSPVAINGPSVGLPRIDRPRYFEANWPILVPQKRRAADPIGVYGERPDGRRLATRKDGTIQTAAASLEEASDAMGIDWMQWDELKESIPPAYTELIGHQLVGYVRARLGNSA